MNKTYQIKHNLFDWFLVGQQRLSFNLKRFREHVLMKTITFAILHFAVAFGVT